MANQSCCQSSGAYGRLYAQDDLTAPCGAHAGPETGNEVLAIFEATPPFSKVRLSLFRLASSLRNSADRTPLSLQTSHIEQL